MVRQRILWTALPNGTHTDGRLRLAVFVSPQLSSDQTVQPLSAFPDFVNWPQTLAGIGLRVTIAGRPPIDNAALTRLSVADPAVWPLLFPQGVRVTTYQFADYHLRQVRSFAVRTVVQQITRLYRDVAVESPEELLRPDSRLLNPVLRLEPGRLE
jgi:hypothetical protein